MQLNLIESIEEQTKPMTGNRSLIAYGIQNEVSDFRAHVAYLAMRIYVFPTASVRKLLSQAEYYGLQIASAYQTGNHGRIETAQGYKVPTSYIEGMQEVVIPPDVYQSHRIDERMLTTNKGLAATEIVIAMLKRDMIPLPVRLDPADSKALQIEGTDILINSALRLQVKCDYRGGDRRYVGCTGNLYIQVAECNPYKRY